MSKDSRILRGTVIISSPSKVQDQYLTGSQGVITRTYYAGHDIKLAGSPRVVTLRQSEIRQITLLEFLFSRHGFGKWKWWQTIPTLLGLIFMGVYAAIDHKNFDPIWSGWAVSIFCFGVIALICYKQNQLRLGRVA